MNRFLKAAVLATASGAVILAPMSIDSASAGKRQRNAWAAGAAGLALGAIVGGALSRPGYAAPPPPIAYDPYAPPPVMYDPYAAPPPVYQPFAPPPSVYYPPSYPSYPTYQPWTRGWYNYCVRRYRSFNPRTGTFLGYDGQYHFCTAN
ncbi:hypothetical protein GCM10011491_36020 [Brucella endophytica]|uniref:Lectin-like protein BA14k n=1 Tax=Brucella endophytica TaxID=1963359 RepID=A0A916SLA6_9HYPH|nr:BA14K family protein [Brucella endophytica]GGB04722.1 hypothetical protein GCM10011491_36020 [Brucella endophytica]